MLSLWGSARMFKICTLNKSSSMQKMIKKALSLLTILTACVLNVNGSCPWENRVRPRQRWCDNDTGTVITTLTPSSTISVTVTPTTTITTTTPTTTTTQKTVCLCGQDGYELISSSCTSCGEPAGCLKIYDKKATDLVQREEVEEICNADGAHLIRWTNDQCLEDIMTFLKNQGYRGRKPIQFWSCGIDPAYTFRGFPEPLGCGECEEGPGGPPPRRPTCYGFSYNPTKKKTDIAEMNCSRSRSFFICQRICA